MFTAHYPSLKHLSFLKKKADIRTREAAHEFIMNGLEAEADGICALKGLSEWEEENRTKNKKLYI